MSRVLLAAVVVAGIIYAVAITAPELVAIGGGILFYGDACRSRRRLAGA